ncbi:acyl carrier protein [Actinophytocola oryzae]|uniref:Methoxymalonate biosynthesis acyl carrier protein n=1 Tax=Actinophytocola oryzae TaxID=502181 RepID=A0A4V3FSL6_9PSEU|nr:acyl carrier protein [Actinophytocola oryzae]TDV47971.1 methoxymalonate biosynthesis acyl carrier protein [Actinophytocola oryzae]
MTDTVNGIGVSGPIAEFLRTRLGQDVPPDKDLFADGLVSSMFAMELVVHLESTFDIAITGSDLKMRNFRTIESMTALVIRLREEPGHD